jgi:hypothetical protein
VDKYAPRGFTQLLSPERINREVLKALKKWDRFVFKTDNHTGEKNCCCYYAVWCLPGNAVSCRRCMCVHFHPTIFPPAL